MVLRQEPGRVTPSAPDDQPWDWNHIVERYANLVYSIPRKKRLSDEDCQDVFQATWLTALRKRPSPPPREEIVGFLAAIAFWEVRNLWRRRKMGQLPEDLAAVRISGQRPPDEVVEGLDQSQQLFDALQRLPERDRELLLFFHFSRADTPSYDAVAARFDVSRNSVGGMLGRARERLERILRQDGFP